MINSTKHRKNHIAKLTTDMFPENEQKILLEALYTADTFTDIIEGADGIGGIEYVKALAAHYKKMSVDSKDVGQWVSYLIREHKKETVQEVIDLAKEELSDLKVGASLDGTLTNLVEGLVSTYSGRTSKGYATLEDVVDEVIDDILLSHDGIYRDRTKTGFDGFDKSLGGGMPHGLVTVGGMPGCGKTSLALAIGNNIAKEAEKEAIDSGGKIRPGVVCIISAEMTRKQLTKRLLTSELQVDLADKEQVSKSQLKKVGLAISSLPLLVDDSDMITTQLVYTRTEAVFLKYKRIRMIAIDFAELIADDGGGTEQSIGKVYIRSAILAKRYDCPVIVISHLGRSLENSPTKVPSMSHLRYSRLAEGMSWAVWLIYYPYQYEVLGKPVTPVLGMPPSPNVSYIIVDKNRDGPTGINPMKWTPQYARWDDQPEEGPYAIVSPQDVLR